MCDFTQIELSEWGYDDHGLPLAKTFTRLREETFAAIAKFELLSIECEQATTSERSDYRRAFAVIPISPGLFDAFFNGRGGYRAQYAMGVETGERFNRSAIQAVAPILISADAHYTEGLDKSLCTRSLEGSYSKLWISKELSSIEFETELSKLPEVIAWKAWRNFWSTKAIPRKGLLAPRPHRPALLLNGTFVRPSDWDEWDQKPNRSVDLHRTGWT